MIVMGIVYTCEHVIDDYEPTVIRGFYLSHAPEGFDSLEFILCWGCNSRFQNFVKMIPGLEDSEIFTSQ